tara:strand:+ start:6087 stop:6746 length:660 start_codon:yes stop_codon:yes gene_type:complete
MKTELCLVSTSGDCAKNGMGNTNEVIPFDGKYKDIVKDYLTAQLEWHVQIHYNPMAYKCKKNMAIMLKLFKHYDRMKNANIFQHKYHFRTQWDLTFNEPGELQQYKPYKISDDVAREISFAKKLKDKKFTALHISERMGSELPTDKLLKYDVWGKYLFFKCQEKYLYWDDDYNGSNPINVFALHIGSVGNEVHDAIKPKSFKWNNKHMQKLVERYENNS